MKVLTMNIHSHSNVHDENDYKHMIETFSEWIIKEEIDVIAIQECSQNSVFDVVRTEELLSFRPCHDDVTITKDNCAWMIVKELEAKGVLFYWTWCSAKLGYDKYDEGLAILSRFPILETEVAYISGIQDYHNWKTRKIVGCKIDTGTEKQWFYSVHMGWWKDVEEPFISQMDRIQNILGSKEENVFLMGDFNCPADVKGEGYDYVKGLGWRDSFELAVKKDSGITVPGNIDGWEQGAEDGLRIDYIWANHPVDVLSSRVMFSGKKEPVVSDHFGVCIIIGESKK